MEVDEAKPPLLMTTGVDPDSSSCSRLASSWPSGPWGAGRTLHFLFWLGRGAYPPPQ